MENKKCIVTGDSERIYLVKDYSNIKSKKELKNIYKNYGENSYVTNNAPSELVIENEEQLMKKLNEGIEDLEKGNVCTLEDAYLEIKQILSE